MTVKDRLELREEMHLEIATNAAVAAGLARTKAEARKKMNWIIERHGSELKASWLQARGGGIKGWIYFLRSHGFEERLVVRRIDLEAETALSSALESDTAAQSILPPRLYTRCS